MKRTRRTRTGEPGFHALGMHALIGVALLLGGCGTDQDTDAEASRPQVDQRYATADALLAYVNELQTREPIDVQTMVSLMYAENDGQREMIDVLTDSVPVMQMEYEMHQRFGRGLMSGSGDPPLRPESPGRMIEHDSQRARAEYESHDGDIESMHFVKIGDRWYISGYTLEYSPHIDSFRNTPPAERESFRDFAAVARDILPNLRNGEYESIEDVQIAMTQAAQRRGLFPSGPGAGAMPR